MVEEMENVPYSETEVRFGAKIALTCCAPFLFLALGKLAMMIIFNPLLFFSIWAIALVIGFLAAASIEFDDYIRPLAAVMEPEPIPPQDQAQAEESEPDLLSASDLVIPTEETPGLGEGESAGLTDQVMIPELSTPIPAPRIQSRSRPLTMRFQKCNGTRIIQSSDLLPSIPELDETNILTSSESSLFFESAEDISADK